MFIFLIISIAIAALAHKFIMAAVNNYEYHGSNTARQEWINFERERLGR